ncbi:armadillo-type protein [Mycena sanguinolenta]|nr:armadillo-type protein [Mycena sanguinolenta]
MDTLSQLSQYDAFRLTIAEVASQVMSQLNSLNWEIRLQALRTISAFAENDAFGDIISSFFQRIVECTKDDDDDVRVQVSKMLLSLVEDSAYRPSIRGALQDCGISHVVNLASDPLKHVRMAALPLIPKVVELDAFPDSVQEIMSTIVNSLSDGDNEQCTVALETIRAVIKAAAYAKELTIHIDKLIRLLKHDGSNTTVPTIVLSTLSVLVRQDTESVDIVVQTMTTVFSDFEDTTEPQFWNAATQVVLALADLGTGPDDKIRNFVSSSVTSALTHSNWRARLLGLSVLGSLDREVFQLQFQTARPVVIKLVESADLDVRLSTIRVAGPLIGELDPDEEHVEIFRAAMQQSWREIVVEMKSPNQSAVGFERLSELSDNYFFDGQFTDLIPLIVTALKGQHQTATWLHVVSKLAAARASYDFNLRNALVQVVPGMVALLSNRNTDTQIRLEVLKNLRGLAEYRKLRAKIQEHVSVVILVLKDHDSKVRVAGLQVLLKLVQAVSPENIPDRIKSTMPALLTLIQDSTTREDSVALITSLAADKTLRSELLAKLLPITLTSGGSRSPISWGRLLLIASFLEHKRLELEESDLRFILCLVTSKNPEVQDFVLKFMTGTLQQYLETWRNATADKFPPSLLSAFASVAQVKR